MTHEKLVAGTTSPTRYTKIIRNPGAGTKYNRTYQETAYVSRYTKTVAGGKDYVPPAPPEPEFEELVVAPNGGANLVADNVYEIGQQVTGKTSVFTGGNPEATAYRSRWQSRKTSSDAWENSNWMNTTNEKNDHSYFIAKPGQVRFQSQARDTSDDPVTQVNSFTSVKEVPFTEIGEVTVDPSEGAAAVMDSQTFTAVVTGGDATDLTYKWTVRSGNAQLDTPNNQASVTYTFIRDGSTQIQCDVSSANSDNSPQSNLAFILVSA
jgi:hypothetical protein